MQTATEVSEKQISQYADELSHVVQRVYHVRERIQSLLDRFVGPQPMNESGEEKGVSEHSHINNLRTSLHRLQTETQLMEDLMRNLEEIA